MGAMRKLTWREAISLLIAIGLIVVGFGLSTGLPGILVSSGFLLLVATILW